MPTLTIDLPSDLANFIEQEVQAGRTPSASNLVGDGLSLLARDRAIETERDAILKAAIGAGLDDLEAGRLASVSATSIAHRILASRGAA